MAKNNNNDIGISKGKHSISFELPILSETKKIDTKPPKRYIYTEADMEQFRSSQIRKDLLTFVRALGQSVKICTSYMFDFSHPLIGLSPSLACLHGSLQCMSGKWMEDIPRDDTLGGRFGNPAFRMWHTRLVNRARSIISTMMSCHKYVNSYCSIADVLATDDVEMYGTLLEDLAKLGYESANSNTCSIFEFKEQHREENKTPLILTREPGVKSEGNFIEHNLFYDSIRKYIRSNNHFSVEEESAITELCSYFCLSFGHPVRIDFGTGHECSFLVFLYCLCYLGFFREGTGNGNTVSHLFQNSWFTPDIIQNSISYISTTPVQSKPAPSSEIMAPVALSIISQYLIVCRNIQSEYVLEPAGSRGVWGLDDYHCIPFYIGACQFQNPNLEVEYTPDCIHDNHLLQSKASNVYMYLGCTKHVMTLKKGAPFNESCPMLDDISRMKSWKKISNGLLRLYNGEVLDKMPVVQHFLFGNVFRATWKSSEITSKVPTRALVHKIAH